MNKPVAWMWLEGTELLNGTDVEQFERVEFSRDQPNADAYGLTPLYTAAPVAQDGMVMVPRAVVAYCEGVLTGTCNALSIANRTDTYRQCEAYRDQLRNILATAQRPT